MCVLQAVQDTGEQLMSESNLMMDEIQQRLGQLAQNWDELNDLAKNRGQRLEESLAHQQFAATVEEEEAWITEKQHLLSGDDYGDTLAAVQVRPTLVCIHLTPTGQTRHLQNAKE